MNKLHFDDLTQITCPLGMLDDETREKLLDHMAVAGRIEIFDQNRWAADTGLMLTNNTTYRAKPAPDQVVFWKNIYPDHYGVHASRRIADIHARPGRLCVHRIEYDKETGLNPTITVDPA